MLFKQRSISRDYFNFSVFVMAVVFLISAWSTYSSYETTQKERFYVYGEESDKVTLSLSETFEYMTNFFRFIGQKIADKNTNDPTVVASILQSRMEKGALTEDIYTWTLFDFVDPNGYVTAASTVGKISYPKKIDPGKRTWLSTAPKSPWTLQVSYPDIGITSGEWIIPAGFGITDKEGKFLGTISIGFNIRKLTEKIQRSLTTAGTSFLLLTNDYHIITSSSNLVPYNSTSFFAQQLTKLSLTGDAGRLPKAIRYQNVTYHYYRYTYPYPYIVLIGDNNTVMQMRFHR